MIFGVGTDIVEVNRIKEIITRNVKFIDKVFSKNEIEYFKNKNFRPEYIAGRFAAKEAVSKAFGTGFMGFDFKDIEIDSNALGKPVVILKGKAKILAQKNGEFKINLSISHEQEYAVAFAVMEVTENENRQFEDNEKD